MRNSNKKGKTTGAKAILLTAKVRQALQLRIAGYSLREVAQQCGYNSEQAVYEAIKTALARSMKEAADEYRAYELLRLDTMLVGIWEMAKAGHNESIDRALKIMAQRAKYLGLEAPVQQVHTGPGGGAVQIQVVYEDEKPIEGMVT